ncbi:MAG: hypothetical protein WA862_06995 [Solirubrobacterales bacterium]
MSDEGLREAGAVEPAAPESSRASNVLAIVGWIAAVLFWPAGLVIGGILASKDDKRGRWILGVAVAIGLIWIVYIVILLQAGDDPARYDYYNDYYE